MTRSSIAVALALAALATLTAVSCAPPLLRLPSGPAVPMPPAAAAAALAQALAPCRTLTTLTAEIAVSGSAGSHRVRGRLSAGVAVPASARLEAAAPFGAPLFIFVAMGDDASVFLPREGRVLEHGRPDAVLEAITGVPLGAADLAGALTTCVAPGSAEGSAVRIGADWQRVTHKDGDETYLRRDRDGTWRLAASVRTAWRIDYSDFHRVSGPDFASDLPQTIHLISIDPRGKAGVAFNLQLVLSQLEINVPLDADVFRLRLPQGVVPLSLDELKRQGPLSNMSRDGRHAEVSSE